MGVEQSKGLSRTAVTTRSSVASGDIKKEDLAALQQRCMPKALQAKVPAPAPAPTPVGQVPGSAAKGPYQSYPGPTKNGQAAPKYAQPAKAAPVDPRVVPFVPMVPTMQRSNSHYLNQAGPLPRSDSMVRTTTQIVQQPLQRSSSLVRTPAQQEVALTQVDAPLVPSFVPPVVLRGAQPPPSSVQIPAMPLQRSDSWVRLQGQTPTNQEFVQVPQQTVLPPKPAVILPSTLPRSSSLYRTHAEQQAVSAGGYPAPASSVSVPMSQVPRQQAPRPATTSSFYKQHASIIPQTTMRTMPASAAPLSPRFPQAPSRVIQSEGLSPQRSQLSSSIRRGRSPPNLMSSMRRMPAQAQ